MGQHGGACCFGAGVVKVKQLRAPTKGTERETSTDVFAKCCDVRFHPEKVEHSAGAMTRGHDFVGDKDRARSMGCREHLLRECGICRHAAA